MARTQKHQKKLGKQNFIINFFYHHVLALHQGLSQMKKQAFLNFMIILVMGIAMALPSLLGLCLHTMAQLSDNWQQEPRAAIYLKTDTKAADVRALIDQIKDHPGVDQVTYISPEQGLDEFKTEANLGNALEELEENPIPGVILVQPDIQTDQTVVKDFLSQLKQNKHIDAIDSDTSWFNKGLSLLQLGSRSLIAIALLLATSMLLVIGNMIFLVFQRYQQDIEVYLLVGATKRFIRRPYVYMGLFYGLCATLSSWAIIAGCYYWLKPSLTNLSTSFSLEFMSTPPPVTFFIISLASGLMLGLLGARLAAWQYLRAQKP